MNINKNSSNKKNAYLVIITILSLFCVVVGTSYGFFANYGMNSRDINLNISIPVVCDKSLSVVRQAQTSTLTMDSLLYNPNIESNLVSNSTVNLNVSLNGCANDTCTYSLSLEPYSSSYAYQRSTTLPYNTNSTAFVATSNGQNLFEYSAELLKKTGENYSTIISEQQVDYISRTPNTPLITNETLTVAQDNQAVTNYYRIYMRIYNLRDYNQDKLTGTPTSLAYLRYVLKVSSLDCDWEH